MLSHLGAAHRQMLSGHTDKVRQFPTASLRSAKPEILAVGSFTENRFLIPGLKATFYLTEIKVQLGFFASVHCFQMCTFQYVFVSPKTRTFLFSAACLLSLKLCM